MRDKDFKADIFGKTAAAWTAENPFLAKNDLGVEVDTGLMKLGVGQKWNATNHLPLPGGSGLSDSDRYIICKAGDDILEKYTAAKALTPGGAARSAANRAYLIVMPGTYTVEPAFDVDADFLDIIGLGSTSLDRGCLCAVKIVKTDTGQGTYNPFAVLAENVRIKGLEIARVDGSLVVPAAVACGGKAGVVFEECIGGDYSFGATAYNTPFAALYESTGLFFHERADGTYVNCIGGHDSFGRISAAGKFINCRAGDRSFAVGGLDSGIVDSPGDASGQFVNCEAGSDSFGSTAGAPGAWSWGGSASGVFRNCVAGHRSFAGSTPGDIWERKSGTASGTFVDCAALDDSFGGGASGVWTSYPGAASGVFTNCTAGHRSFGYDTSSVTGTFTRCKAGNGSFGAAGTEFGTASGVFTDCEAGGGSFGQVADGVFTRCTADADSFGGPGMLGYASGVFSYCIAGAQSFGANAATGQFVYCRVTAGLLTPVSGSGFRRFCVDGNNEINNDGPVGE